MSARDMIDSNEVRNFVYDFRRCRDYNLGSNCEDYARERLVERNRTESRQSIDSVVRHGRDAVNFGNAANQSADTRRLNTSPGTDPTDTQYGGGNTSRIGYRYGAQVTVTVVGGRNAGQTFPIYVEVESRGVLTAGEVRQEAIDEAGRIADAYLKDSDRLSGSDLNVTADVRITSAYRIRET